MRKVFEDLKRTSHIEHEKDWVKVSIDFYGWSWNVEKWVTLTGSSTILTIHLNWKKIVGLIDFGMFQWWKKDQDYNEKLPFDLSKIDFVIATHTHLDHIWKMLFLSKDEFHWKIWTTNVSKEIMFLMLKDIIKNQHKNSISKKEKLANKINNLKLAGSDVPGLEWLHKQIFKDYINELEEEYKNMDEENIKKEYFDKDDFLNLVLKVNSVDYYEKLEVANDIQLSFINAWHLPGSAQAILKIKTWRWKYLNIWFSWDIGSFKKEILWWKPDISKEKLDLFVIESTYAWRYHVDKIKEQEKFIESINETIKNKWKIIIPSFVQWRAQEVIKYLYDLMEDWKIKKMLVFFDSLNMKKINDKYSVIYKDTLWNVLSKAFLNSVTSWRKRSKSNRFLKQKWSCILIASWWMMDVWTINKYIHLIQNPKNLFISVWYQAPWTRGNNIFEKHVKQIEVPWVWKLNVNAKLLNIRSFSWHWDQEDIIKLFKKMKFSKDWKIIINHWEESVDQYLFWLTIKSFILRICEVLLTEFDEKIYK